MSGAALRLSEQNLPLALTTLLKGVVYADAEAWRHVLALQAQIRDYVETIGLRLVLDETEGYAFLRSRSDEEESSGPPIPRLVRRRALTFETSLLLALLRKRLAEFDALSGESRLFLTRQQIVELLRVFLAAGANEAKVVDIAERQIRNAVDLQFLREVTPDRFEVRRILKAFVDGQWLTEFDTRLAEYEESLRSSGSGAVRGGEQGAP